VFSGADVLASYVQGVGLAPSQGGFGGLASSIVRGADSLKPERTKEFETGFDIGLFRDHADLSFTYYRAITSDVILLTPLPPTSGFERQARNSAKFRNAGAEISLNVRPITTKNFAWDVGVQWAKNQSRVLDLGGPDFIRLDPNNINPFAVVQNGEEIGVFRDQGYARCGESPSGLDAVVPGVDLAEVCAGAPSGALYLAEDGFPVVDQTERIVGNPNPDWTGSVRTGVRYKRFNISGLLDIRNGGQLYNGTRAALLSYGTHKDTEQRADCSGEVCVGNEHRFGASDSPVSGPVVGPGVDPATGLGIPVPIGENWYSGTAAPGSGAGGLFGGPSGAFFEDGGFVKLREISVAYTFDYPWVQRTLGFSTIDVRFSARNLKTWTDYTGYDPETNLGGAIQATRGLDYFNQPQSRSFSLSVTLNR
jgi:hypothetical protein